MEDQTKVSINLEEYKEFIISQYENGKIKKTLIQEIKELKENQGKLKFELKEQQKIIDSKKEGILRRLFKKDYMVSYGRQEQTNIERKYAFGFEENDVILLKELGITVKEMIDYINKQWDEKEQPQPEPAADPGEKQ